MKVKPKYNFIAYANKLHGIDDVIEVSEGEYEVLKNDVVPVETIGEKMVKEVKNKALKSVKTK